MEIRPKYVEIMEFIKEEIASERLQRGSRLLTEKELCERFNTSRQTANKALQILTNEGIVSRTRGRGSFVNDTFVEKSIRKYTSFTQDLASIGVKAGSILIEYALMQASEVPMVAKKLQLKENDLIHYFVRLRTGNDKPLAISYSYISYLIMPDFKPSILDGSLSEYLNSIGVPHKRSDCYMSACLPSEKQKALLKVNHTVALLCNHHITYTYNNQPYEYIHAYYIGNSYSYNFSTISDTE